MTGKNATRKSYLLPMLQIKYIDEDGVISTKGSMESYDNIGFDDINWEE